MDRYISQFTMYKIVGFSLIVCLSFISCDYLNSFFHEDANRIDFTSVDEYPFFSTCDSLAAVEKKEKCFEETLVGYLQKDLEKHYFIATDNASDAIIIHIEIDKEGKAQLQYIEKATNRKENIPELENVIRESIAQLPTLTPAKKRGNYVKSTFMIPLYIIDE